MKNFSKINRAFTAKKKFLFFAMSAIVLGMASCGEEQNGAHLKNFKMELTEPATSSSLEVTVTPSDAEQYYVASFMWKRSFLKNGPQFIVDYELSRLKENCNYPDCLEKGVTHLAPEGELPGMEYVMYAFPVRAGYELDGTIDAFEYAFFTVPDIEYEEVPGNFEIKNASYTWTEDNMAVIVAKDAQTGLQIRLELDAPQLQRNFTEDDFLNYCYLIDGGSSYSYITHAQLQGHINDINSEYILRGWVSATNGKKYTIGLHVPLTVKGEFRVGKGEDDKVYFSRGNLQYRASTKTWRFAPYQMMVIGEDNAKISDTYDGWIDLFGWGTGDAPTKSSRNDADYATFTDWGDNVIDNGCASPGVWRTLESDEWDYLFHGRPNAAKLFGYMTVGSVEGVFLLPDDWDFSSSASSLLKTADDQGFEWNEQYNRWIGPEHAAANCMVSLSQWMTLENAGAVFLPMENFREGTSLYNDESYPVSLYWSASRNEEKNSHAYDLVLRDKKVIPSYSDYRHSGNNVRLVKDK